MNLDFLLEYFVPIIAGICVCIGYILKNLIKTDKINRFIPLIVGVLGVIIAIWTYGAFTPQVLLMGLFSGLASTGLYEMFKNLIERK